MHYFWMDWISLHRSRAPSWKWRLSSWTYRSGQALRNVLLCHDWSGHPPSTLINLRHTIFFLQFDQFVECSVNHTQSFSFADIRRPHLPTPKTRNTSCTDPHEPCTSSSFCQHACKFSLSYSVSMLLTKQNLMKEAKPCNIKTLGYYRF